MRYCIFITIYLFSFLCYSGGSSIEKQVKVYYGDIGYSPGYGLDLSFNVKIVKLDFDLAEKFHLIMPDLAEDPLVIRLLPHLSKRREVIALKSKEVTFYRVWQMRA